MDAATLYRRAMTDERRVPGDHPYRAELEAEKAGWYEIVDLVRSLTPDECLQPGYYDDPAWTVRDLVAHLGTWLAQAQVQFEQIAAGTFVAQAVDVDGLNAALLGAMADQPWDVCWAQANSARTMMIEAWYSLGAPSEDAAWWVRKAGNDHYAEHLARLREWVADLAARRAN